MLHAAPGRPYGQNEERPAGTAGLSEDFKPERLQRNGVSHPGEGKPNIGLRLTADNACPHPSTLWSA